MNRGLHIALIEPFFGGSHAAWAMGYREHSEHRITLVTQSGAHWKWRMHGGAITCAQKVNDMAFAPDLFLCSDMLDAAVFRSLLKAEWRSIPMAMYFHENQLTYPWKDGSEPVPRDRHYAFINYTSALAADHVFFNSSYHMKAFLDALPPFLRAFPDDRNDRTMNAIAAKSRVLHVGMDLARFEPFVTNAQITETPIVLWNHRHEHDKNPETFFNLLYRLDDIGADFQIAVAGESYSDSPGVFAIAKERLAHRIVHWGYCQSFDEYARLLCKSTLLPVTSRQEFFGISVAEAIHCGVQALLPERLSYPDLFGSVADFYQDEDDLFRKALHHLQKNKQRATTSVAHFDWKLLAPQYDAIMTEISAHGS